MRHWLPSAKFPDLGKVSFPSPGKVRVEVKGQKVELDYPSQFKAELETIKLDDPRLSNVWGKEILSHHN